MNPEPKIFIAGKIVEAPRDLIRRYVLDRDKTVARFDLVAGRFEEVSLDLIRATRIVSSRISNAEADWFIAHSAKAPWELIDPQERLGDADPSVEGGLYDKAKDLWSFFVRNAGHGVGVAKIAKVLHLMRPHFFPILDSEVKRRYRQAARQAAGKLNETRPDQAPVRYAYWTAVRSDLLASEDGLEALRLRLLTDDEESVRTWVKYVSDVRMLDVLAWS